MQLRPEDDRVGVWTANYGAIFEVILFALLVIHRYVWKGANFANVANVLTANSKKAQTMSHLFLVEMLDSIRVREEMVSTRFYSCSRRNG